MKNLYFLAAVAAFALGSCTVKEALDPSAGPDDEAKAIGFDTFLDRVPQNGIKPLASVMDIGELKNSKQGFIVQAYKHATTDWNAWTDGARTATPNFMPAQTVTWSGGTSTSASWTYSPIEYWPVSNSKWDKVSFFAYTPAPNSNTLVTFSPAGAAGENPKLLYTMSTSQIYHTDLIVDAEYNRTGDAGKVTFKFDHVLSRIGFKAQLKNDYAPATVTMSGMTFTYNYLRRTGTYTFNSGTDTGADKDNKAGKWGVPEVVVGNYMSGALLTDPVEVTTTPYDISGTMGSGYLMLIPQENADNQAYVTVAYTIKYPDDSDHEDVTVPSSGNTGRVYLPKTTWEPGIAYTYTLYIAAPREMTFHIEKDNWNGWGLEVPGDIFYP
jgi:hypothetical protein